jgi:hypothetical protein
MNARFWSRRDLGVTDAHSQKFVATDVTDRAASSQLPVSYAAGAVVYPLAHPLHREPPSPEDP